MENNVQMFNNEEFGSVRTVMIDNEPWFVGKDVADILEYQNGSRDINRHIDEDDRRKIMVFDGNQDKETIVINESGLYALILSSKMRNAKRFKHWVTSEVLPSIRKIGSYGIQITEEDKLLMAIMKAPDAVSQAKAISDYTNFVTEPLHQKIAEQQPSVEFAKQVSQSENSILIRDYCKVLHKNSVKVGERKLFNWLIENKYLMENKLPYQKYADYFDVIEHAVTIGNAVYTKYTTRINGRGQVYFTPKLIEAFGEKHLSLVGA